MIWCLQWCKTSANVGTTRAQALPFLSVLKEVSKKVRGFLAPLSFFFYKNSIIGIKMIPSGILNPQIHLSKTGTLEKQPADRTAVFNSRKHFGSPRTGMQNYSQVNVYTQIIKIKLQHGNRLATTVRQIAQEHAHKLFAKLISRKSPYSQLFLQPPKACRTPASSVVTVTWTGLLILYLTSTIPCWKTLSIINPVSWQTWSDPKLTAKHKQTFIVLKKRGMIISGKPFALVLTEGLN